MVVDENPLAGFSELCRRGEAAVGESCGHLPGDIASKVSGFPAVSPYAIEAPQRRRLWATATRSITLVTLASPRTVNWETP